MKQKSVAAALIEGAATLGMGLIIAYYTDAQFRYKADGVLRQALYRVRQARWKAWLRNLPEWRRQLYEQKHGPLEG